MKKVNKIVSVVMVLAFMLTLIPAQVLAQDEVVCESDVVVQAEDWLSKLANKFYGDAQAYQAIADATNTKAKSDNSYATITNVNVIEPGWKLCIPSAEAAGVLIKTAGETQAAAAENAPFLELYHDKSSWAENADQVGKSAAAQIGVGFASVPYPDTTTYQSTVRAALGTDSPPDLFTWWSGYRMEDIVATGGAEDLTPIWDKYINSGEYGKGIASAYTFDNKVYAVPFLVSYWVVYYNKHVFDEYSLKPPTTWEEFMAINDTLKEKGVIPLAQTVDGRWPSFIMFEELVLRTGGPDVYNDLVNGKIGYDDPAITKAMELWKEMIDKGYFTDPGTTFGTADNALLGIFKKGDVGMIPIGDWYSATLVEGGMKPGVDYDAFIMPNANPDLPPALFFETAPLLVSSKGPNKDKAMQVADWFMSVSAQEQWCNLMGFSSANSRAIIDNPVGKQIAKQISDSNAQALQRYWEATPPDIVETAVDEFSRFILDPSTMESVQTTIQQKADSVWASRK